MPADYLAVKNSCIEKHKKENEGKVSKEQIQQCKKMAAIWFFKKHGVPVNKVSESTYEIVLTNAMTLKGSFDIIKDGIVNIATTENNEIIGSILFEQEDLLIANVIFNQPFKKEESDYKFSEYTEPNYCGNCIHFVSSPTMNMCHFLQGEIGFDFICKYHLRSLFYDEENEKILKEREIQKNKEHMAEMMKQMNLNPKDISTSSENS